MKKKIACAVLGAMLLGLSLTACGNADNPSTGEITESGYPKRECRRSILSYTLSVARFPE